MKTKTFLTLLILGMVVTSFLSSCENKPITDIEEQITSEKLPVIRTNPFNFVGELHNQGLAAIKDSLTKYSNQAVLLTKDEIKDKIGGIAEEYCQSSKKLECHDKLSKDIAFLKTTNYNETRSTENVPDTIIFSKLAENELHIIEEILDSDDYSYISEQLYNIEQDILSENIAKYTDVELYCLLTAISVGKYSNEYWNGSSLTRSNSLASKIAKTDAVGAVKGIVSHAKIIYVCSCTGIENGALAAAYFGLQDGIIASAIYGFVEM